MKAVDLKNIKEQYLKWEVEAILEILTEVDVKEIERFNHELLYIKLVKLTLFLKQFSLFQIQFFNRLGQGLNLRPHNLDFLIHLLVLILVVVVFNLKDKLLFRNFSWFL